MAAVLSSPRFKKVIVVGLDGLEPDIVEPMLARGELPALDRLRRSGGYSRIRTTHPAQTPVAWSTFATGTNPGGHGIFDFVTRDPATYLPAGALSRYEQKNSFVAPRAVNLRRGRAVWQLLADAGLASIVLRCPCTYPPDQDVRGRMLAGVGVPDLRGSLGTSVFYTSAAATARESETVVRISVDASGHVATQLPGPRDPRTGTPFELPLVLEIDRTAAAVRVRAEGQRGELRVHRGEWSDWLKVRFKTGLLSSLRGMVRFHLRRLEPEIELYASPINFDPEAPAFPISQPPEYAGELAARLGPFYTAGMAEDHTGLQNGRFDEAAYLSQCNGLLAERERMLHLELDRFDGGLLFCLFDTPDRVQHMFWRFRDPGHPSHRIDADLCRVIEDHYRACDAIVGRVIERAGDAALVTVLSDHGMKSFRRGVHLNSWLHAQGFLHLQAGVAPGDEAGDLLRRVDWSRTRAYALGLAGIYLNLRGREASGIVAPDDADAVGQQIATALTGLTDPAHATTAVRRVLARDRIYSGPYAAESPDLLVDFAAGYRVSWATPLGGIPDGLFDDNDRAWSGDHIVDPDLAPGVLFMNAAFDSHDPSLVDLAPTILAALGAPKGPAMEGASLLR